ncbi:MAG: XdhC family protein [Gemmatimonadetes bacterium]|nr:XdhC family protein [Gemmatimonadota bacterium]NNM04089.1 XdhC family protein [Gemmatimonadota bacterium]
MTRNPTLTLADTAAQLLGAMDAGEQTAIVAIVSHPDETRAGERVLIRGGELIGSFDDPVADKGATELATRGLSGDPKVLSGVHSLPLRDGAEASVYLELHHPPAEMVIVGAGHIAQPLCTLGSLLGLRVRVLDDRPEFATRERFPEAKDVLRVDFSDPFDEVRLHSWSHVVLVTRGHRYDFECLRNVLQHEVLPGYIGMIGSRRRVRATFDALLEEGFPREVLAQVRAPIGLDIGAETPAEIAVSVVAEMVREWRGGSGSPMREVERVLERLVSGPDKSETDGSGQGESA